MKKAAIITLYDDVNLGNKLQNYAVQELCRQLGYQAQSLVNRDLLWSLSWKGKIVAALGFPRKIARQRRLMLSRRRRFRSFSKKHLSVYSHAVQMDEDLRGLNDEFDAFVVGSDQVWHNWSGSKRELSYFFLEFAERCKRVCISPSFGFEQIPQEFETQYVRGLNGFARLCCREESGCALIEKASGRKAERLCDPTMMLGMESWRAFAEKPAYNVPKRYMLVYCLAAMTAASREKMEAIARERDLEIVDIYSFDMPEYYCTTPDEFVYLIENSDYVFTDSFHACVFSIMFHRDFSAVVRGDSDGEKMRGRLDTLLRRFGLQERALYHAGETGTIDYGAVDEILSAEKTAGLSFLKAALDEAAWAQDKRNDE